MTDTTLHKIGLWPRYGVVDTNVNERMMGKVLHASVPLERNTNKVLGGYASKPVTDLTSDVFFSLYKADPSLVESYPVSRYLNAALMRLTYSAPNFESLRSSTVGDIPAALISTSTMVSTLMSDEAVMAAMKLQEQMEAAQEKLNELAKQLQQMEVGAGEVGEQPQSDNKDEDDQQQQTMPQFGGGEQQQQDQKQQQKDKNRLKRKIKAAEKRLDGMEEQMEKRVERIENNQLSQGMAGAAVQSGKEGNKKLNGMMTSWGIEPGEMSFDDANYLISIAMKEESNLALIAEVGGRVAGISAESLQAVRDSYVGAPSEPTYTRDFMRMFPMERAYMSKHAPPFIRSMKITQWAQRGVMGLRPKSEGKKRGALVIAVDGSSSMNANLCAVTDSSGVSADLDRGDTAKVLAVGVARAMREDRFERRRYTMFTFSSARDEIRYTKSSDEWYRLMRWIEYDPNGGTDFDRAFTWAIEEMERFEAEGTLGADLLFISDGESHLDNDIKRRVADYKDRTGARIFYIQVVSGLGNYSLRDNNLDGIVDALAVISKQDDIADVPGYLAQQVSSVFAQVD